MCKSAKWKKQKQNCIDIIHYIHIEQVWTKRQMCQIKNKTIWFIRAIVPHYYYDYSRLSISLSLSLYYFSSWLFFCKEFFG